MRISDWSSDVCSSDLLAALIRFGANAIVEQDDNDEMDDAAIDRLIGRAVAGEGKATESLFTTGEEALIERQRKLQEVDLRQLGDVRSEEHTSELQSLMRSSYAVFSWTKKTVTNKQRQH